MSRGVLLVANNTEQIDYIELSIRCATRVKQHLNLPVSLITGENCSSQEFEYIINTNTPVEQNRYIGQDRYSWKNFDRYQVYELSPYRETLLLDVDYVINSDCLNRLWDYNSSIMCYQNLLNITNFDLADTETIGIYRLPMVWATVVLFQKDVFSQTVFRLWKRVQDNYAFYAAIYKFNNQLFRNDFALSIALHLASGQLGISDYIIPWSMINVFPDCSIEYLNQEYQVLVNRGNINGPEKLHRVELTELDFHCMNKADLIGLNDV